MICAMSSSLNRRCLPMNVQGIARAAALARSQECPVRPVQVRAARRLLPLQDGELMAQDQDLRGLPCLLTPGEPQPRS
jgi:hypothetical protein